MADPTMPETPTMEMIEAMLAGWRSVRERALATRQSYDHRQSARAAYAALRRHLADKP